MARTFIRGGVAATQLQAGKPFIKRIIRIGGDSGYLRSDGLTCEIDGSNKINFKDVFSPDWNAGADGQGGELIMVEFPTTIRNAKVLIEEAWYNDGVNPTQALDVSDPGIRCKVALLAEDQDVQVTQGGDIATPLTLNNFIEINVGETATVSSRTKAMFILVQKFDYDIALNEPAIFDTGPVLTQGVPGASDDAISILVTAVLDHEPTPGAV
jgi:hypothetical protein